MNPLVKPIIICLFFLTGQGRGNFLGLKEGDTTFIDGVLMRLQCFRTAQLAGREGRKLQLRR
jgi:hypothetical protein